MKAGERAYTVLRDDILNWRLAPGTPLAEIEQAERIGVSRTPVREALARLIAEGLVESRGRVDSVAAFSTDHLVELFEFREALETQAARLAARRRDPEVFRSLRDEFQLAAAKSSVDESERDAFYALVARFDAAVDRSVDNRYLTNALTGLRTHLVRARRLSRDNPERLARAAAEHLLITEAILAQDETLAVQATAVHLHSSLVNVMATLRQTEPQPA
ncbi:GntR family transcriptional regulator [Homoserinimonas sp. OAct 916]|uniref:GntR family transcriptional regulator n=1 Tax=Homoserinimonas sp. OAct 916 TaxID=2211450 RepID=UPI000DBE2676|nr:GntR family transcriptional regulator [Homoserinimonas sp. OAct 916]